MCGSLRQEDRCNLLLGCISKEDILYIIGCENGKHMKDAITKEILKKISNLVSEDDVQRACDAVGISTNAYHALHGLLKDALRERGITENLFPIPHRVRLARKANNDLIWESLGEYKHIKGSMMYSSTSAKSREGGNSIPNGAKSFGYHQYNNIFVDLKRLQQAMVKFYALSPQGNTICNVIFNLY